MCKLSLFVLEGIVYRLAEMLADLIICLVLTSDTIALLIASNRKRCCLVHWVNVPTNVFKWVTVAWVSD